MCPKLAYFAKFGFGLSDLNFMWISKFRFNIHPTSNIPNPKFHFGRVRSSRLGATGPKSWYVPRIKAMLVEKEEGR